MGGGEGWGGAGGIDPTFFFFLTGGSFFENTIPIKNSYKIKKTQTAHTEKNYKQHEISMRMQ